MKPNIKIPPQALSSEKVILASFLSIPEALEEYLEELKESDFYALKHGVIFKAIEGVFSSSSTVDIVSVLNEIKKDSRHDYEAYTEYLSELLSETMTIKKLDQHVKTLRDKSDLRKLIAIGNNILSNCYDNGADKEELLSDAEVNLMAIREQTDKTKPVHISKVVSETLKVVQESMKRGGKPDMTTGFKMLDRFTGGFRGGDLIILAGRPGMGKTSLALNLAVNHNKPVAIFSLEMPKIQLCTKYLSSYSKLPLAKIRAGLLSKSDLTSFGQASNIVANLQLYIDDTPGIKVPELRSKLRRLKRKHGIKAAYVDYLQLMRGHEKGQSREQEISSISRSLKEIAKELDIPIVALSQLSRSLESRPDKRPKLSDLRESGAIEQDADMVLFIYRPEMYDKAPENIGVTEIIIGKQRNGPTTTVSVEWEPLTTTFKDKDKEINTEGVF